MQFLELLKRAEITPRQCHGNAEIGSVACDSRRCKAGSCFVAISGWAQDGHRYIPQALAAGSAAVVCEKPDGIPDGVAWAAVDDARLAVGRLAQAIHGWPSRKLTAIAVTGTNGKTTTAHLIRSVLQANGCRPAMLGTITYETGLSVQAAGTTTPDPVLLADMCAEMVAAGRTHLVMEASSHAIHQRRIAGIDFRVAVFTNLSGEHLDYHQTMENYAAAKQMLFTGLSEQATAVLNRDDEHNAGEVMARGARAAVIWYGLSGAADLQARIHRIDLTGTQFDMIYKGRQAPACSSLIGRHNVFNWLSAAGACLALGFELDQIVPALAQVRRVPGRLERVNVEAPYQVFVDYAHTDDALANVLGSFAPVKKGRVIVVFGCGGDRDRTKRPRMAKVAEELADRIIITSDNPRSEQPQAIIDEILAGLGEAGRRKTEVQSDRRAAIELAIAQARPGDVVLLAGKGHEDYQLIGGRTLHFNDVEVAEEVMRRQEARA